MTKPVPQGRAHHAATTAPTIRVAGVDGCRGGWVVAHADGCELVSAFAPLLDRFDVLGVDMPIGLPERWGRSADAQARRFLAPRGSTVFPVPPRALLDHDDYALANATSRESFGQGLTRQTFHLFPKLRELDALMTPAIAERVVEIHPECAFARLGGHPLPPKRSRAGRAERRRLLEAVFGSLARPTRVPEHDVLDAYAVLWSAHRFANGVADVFGAEERDAKGLPMRIVS